MIKHIDANKDGMGSTQQYDANCLKPARGRRAVHPVQQWLGRSAALITVMGFCMATAVAAVASGWWVDITNDRVENVKSALAQGEDPNATNAQGQPALMQAVKDGAWGVYDLLLAHRRIDVNIENGNGETPLMYLAIVGDVKRAQELIKRGAKVNRLGWTPLHYAASKGHADMIKLLLANKAIVNAPSPDGTTPLMMAAFSGNTQIVRTLLAAGADSTTLNLKRQSAADWARLRNHTTLATSLDQLSNKVLAQRAAMRARNRAADAANRPTITSEPPRVDTDNTQGLGRLAPAVGADETQGSHKDPYDVRAVDIRPAVVPPALGLDKAPSKPAEPQEGSTSRYFNLDRFNDEPAY